MKKIVTGIIIPLTIISFSIFTKWWYALPIDAIDTMYYGFPFPFVGEGWHTSMSLQFFVLECLLDLLTYFLFWYFLFLIIKRFSVIKAQHPLTVKILWSIAGLALIGSFVILGFSDPVFHLKRPYEWKIMATGYDFIWQKTKRPVYTHDGKNKNDVSEPPVDGNIK